jgi:hypothetical protein
LGRLGSQVNQALLPLDIRLGVIQSALSGLDQFARLVFRQVADSEHLIEQFGILRVSQSILGLFQKLPRCDTGIDLCTKSSNNLPGTEDFRARGGLP